MQDLLDTGFDVNGHNKSGYRPLHWAGWIGAPDTIQVLLEAGADISARDIRGDTALHVAAWAGSPENVAFLLKTGANARAKNYDGNQRVVHHKPPNSFVDGGKFKEGVKGGMELSRAP